MRPDGAAFDLKASADVVDGVPSGDAGEDARLGWRQAEGGRGPTGKAVVIGPGSRQEHRHAWAGSQLPGPIACEGQQVQDRRRPVA